MAFLKYARATVLVPSVDIEDWFRVRKIKTASAKKIEGYDPKQFLLSHCTIIASVDTEDVPNVKLGTDLEDGFTIDRKYQDFYVTADTSIYINGNADCWERQLLVNSYPTFIGGENYLEHVQIPSLSKGKVIDAVARDLGDTIYIDILVATDRKHTELINDILSKKIATLSMGCEVIFTVCTKCGNVAFDETQLCPHIKYEKGQTFTDSDGRERVIAELCGHRDEPDSVIFIEASWVRDPAFTGAVLHTILNPEIYDLEKVSGLLRNAFEAHRIKVTENGLRKVAARLVLAQPPEEEEGEEEEPADEPVDEEGYEGDIDWGGEPDEEEDLEWDDEGMEWEEEEEASPTTYKELTDKIKERVLTDIWEIFIDESEEEKPSSIFQITEIENDTLLESSKKARISRNIEAGLDQYRKNGWQSLRGKYSGLELLLIAKKAGVSFTYDDVETLLKVGPICRYGNDPSSFLQKCQYIFNKSISGREIKKMILGGYVLNLAKS